MDSYIAVIILVACVIIFCGVRSFFIYLTDQNNRLDQLISEPEKSRNEKVDVSLKLFFEVVQFYDQKALTVDGMINPICDDRTQDYDDYMIARLECGKKAPAEIVEKMKRIKQIIDSLANAPTDGGSCIDDLLQQRAAVDKLAAELDDARKELAEEFEKAQLKN